MAEKQNSSFKMFGNPWVGVEEHPGVGDPSKYVEDAWNMEFEGSLLKQRAGRIPMTPSGLKLRVPVIFSAPAAGGAIIADYTANLSDGDPSTFAVSLFNSGEYVYIGSPVQFFSLSWTVGTASAVTPTSATYEYYDGSGWNGASVTTDTTVTTGSKVFAQSGVQSLSLANTDTESWYPGNPDRFGDTTDQTFYWLRIRYPTVGQRPGAFWSASALTLGLGSTAPAINGLYEYTTRGGKRFLCVGMDSATGERPALGDGSAYPAGCVTAPRARLFWFDPASNEYVMFNLPASARRSAPDAYWTFVDYAGQLVCTNGCGALCTFDGTTFARLGAVAGLDARAYLAAPPECDRLTVYRNRLVTAKGLTVVLSEFNNADNNIPTDGTAPQGGANLWPGEQNFDVFAPTSDDKITGFAVLNDQLVIFTKNSISAYTDDALQVRSLGVGCVAPRSIVNTGRKIYFYAKDGLYEYDGYAPKKISWEVEPTLVEHVGVHNQEKLVAEYVPRKHQYRLNIPLRDGTTNKMALVYDYESGGWTKFGGFLPWAATSSSNWMDRAVAASYTGNVGGGPEITVTGDYSGNLIVEDRGTMDYGKRFLAFVVFKRLAWESDQIKAWRNTRVEVAHTNANLGLLYLLDGTPLRAVLTASGSGSSGLAFSTSAVYKEINAVLASQPTYTVNNTYPVQWPSTQLYGGMARRTLPINIPLNAKARSIQPVLFSGGGINVTAPLVVRGLEISYRIEGERS